MVELIHLINDISTTVKLGWAGVLVWGVVQFMWYQRGRVFPEDIDVEPASEEWSIARLLALFKRSSSDTGGQALSIAPTFDAPTHETAGDEADLGVAAGVALESLLDTDGSDPDGGSEDADAFAGGKKAVSYQSTMSY